MREDRLNSNPFSVFQSPVKPDEVYTPQASPKKNSKAALKYSPSKSYTRDTNNFINSQVGRDFINRADDSPLRSSRTARQLFTENESPRRAVNYIDPFNDQLNIHDDEENDIVSHYSIFNNGTNELNHRLHEVQEPDQTLNLPQFDDLNIDAFSGQDSLGHIPMLNPSELNLGRSPVQQERLFSATSNSTFGSKKSAPKSFSSSYFTSDQSTISVPYDNSSKIHEYGGPDEKSSQFNHSVESFDGQLMRNASMIQPRRNNFRKNVIRSKAGNLVLPNPIPDALYNIINRKDSAEFTELTYSAVTSDPNDFVEDGFLLRQVDLQRETEIVICITMYNEDEAALTRTLHSVFKNIEYLTKRKNSATWKDERSWEKIVVCIISDGRNKVSPGVLECLGVMGVYQDGIAKSFVNKKEVKAHLFEYTTQVSVDENLNAVELAIPVQMIFCLKEKNAKKINSHRWLFNAICPVLEPNVCVLLDVGTKPNESAVYNLWKAFDLDSNVAGAAGEIIAMKGNYWSKLINPLVASQNFEYKMSNILDKPCESAFGYITVLPGALSAYRYEALKNHDDGTGPLHSYFQGESQDNADMANIFSANMYLAEDRILAWELVAKRGDSWVLKYCKDAKGETDVPETLSEFVLQRRRWLNGAFFAALFSLKQHAQIFKTSHSAMRKFFFHIEFIYQGLTLLFSFFSIANFYIIFYYLAGSLITIAGKAGKACFEIMNYVCICTLLAMLVISMGNKPNGAPMLFWVCVILLTICGVYSIIAGFYFLSLMIKSGDTGSITSLSLASIAVSLASTYGLYVLMSLLYLDPWHVISSSLQYFMMLPAYTCLLQIYAFCNTHDVSWGTKGDTEVAKSLGSVIVTTDENGETHIVDSLSDEFNQKNLNDAYGEVCRKLLERRHKPIVMRDKDSKDGGSPKKEVSKEDYYRDVRSRVVLFWVIANVLLVMTITQIWGPSEIKSNKYLAFILWSVFGFSCFRFLGSSSFLIHLIIRKIIVTKNKWELKKEKGTRIIHSAPQ